MKQSKIIPLSVPCFEGNELKYVSRAINSEWVSTKGAFVTEFEGKIADYMKTRHAVACQNGTSGLHLSLLLAGVKSGDEVIAPAVTFIAPINVIKYTGAEPVFMDCDDYLNMDMEKTSCFLKKECVRTKSGLKNKRTGRLVKALLPVHIFGNACDMENLMDLAGQYRLKVIE
ncbi:MAG: aminotransferase class I/II-fold pyridoxal phosphate-dependent enzyme, partial [bacterium]|nr:aminotransferase class I/II-fold pyridoxal phosphate-dependent enzyme [bacterium]